MRNIKYIVIHTTAGYKDAESVQNYFLNVKGWNTGGYHIIIELDGTIKQMYDFNKITNGVKGYNSNSIHISYVGGLNYDEYKKGNYIAEDTRTDEQKISIQQAIMKAQDWIRANNNSNNVLVLGHRDFSKDSNNSGVIESWERIKECPCFDAIPEYSDFQINEGKLPDLPNK